MNKKRFLMLFFAALVVLCLVICLTSPTPVVIADHSVPLTNLNENQRRNVCLAAGKIDGTYIYPGKEFSFNGVTGPRTAENGFTRAKTYFEGAIIDSEGGGICFLSSAIYNATLEANLKILSRVAHTKPISSFPPGLDATVWYGINDLKFLNNTAQKIKISSKCEYDNLNIDIKGSRKPVKSEIIIRKYSLSRDKLRVVVYKKWHGSLKQVSDDIYTIKS